MEVTQITQIRRKVLTMLSKMAYDGNLPDHVYDILQIVQEDSPRLRCCVHKERAVLKERINVALGLDTDLNIIEAAKKAVSEPVDRTQHVIAVLPEGCSACPVNKYMITDVCRRCLTHRCMNGCPKKAISVYQGRAHIDYDVCVECGNCKRACPYGAVVEISRPCENACKVQPFIWGLTKRRKSIKMSVWNAVPAVGLAPSAPSRNGATLYSLSRTSRLKIAASMRFWRPLCRSVRAQGLSRSDQKSLPHAGLYASQGSCRWGRYDGHFRS